MQNLIQFLATIAAFQHTVQVGPQAILDLQHGRFASQLRGRLAAKRRGDGKLPSRWRIGFGCR